MYGILYMCQLYICILQQHCILSSVYVTMEMIALIHLSFGLHPAALPPHQPSVTSGSPRRRLPNRPSDSRHSLHEKKASREAA